VVDWTAANPDDDWEESMNAPVFHRMVAAGLSLCTVLALNGCIINDKEIEVSPIDTPIPAMFGDHLNLYKGSQFLYYSLRIAAGNYMMSDYVTDEGEKKHGQSVGLWLIMEDRPETYKTVRVYLGQILLYEQYKIQIL
jgi:hypothetical protein